MNAPNIFTHPELLHPAPSVVLKLTQQHSGLTLADLHALGYRSVYDALKHLLDEELIFQHNDLYLPNT